MLGGESFVALSGGCQNALWLLGAVPDSSPAESPIGHANVVWIIRWQSRQARDADLPRAFASDEWKAVLAEHPDRGGYLQSTSRFMAGGSCCSSVSFLVISGIC